MKKFKWLTPAGRWLVALVYLAAGIGKLGSPHAFVDATRQAMGLAAFPDFLILSIPVFEVILALGLLLRWRERAWWLGSSALLAAFTVWLVWGMTTGAFLACGCFGDLFAIPAPWAVVRNGILLGISLWFYRDQMTTH